MKVTIIIPTVHLDRIKLLFKEVKSIEKGRYKDFHIAIIVDGSKELYMAIRKGLPDFKGTIVRNRRRCGWVASINRGFTEVDSDYYVYGSDDLIFPPDCIETAMKTMKKRFPDGYGIVTLGRKHKAIFGLIGRKWVNHFPNRQVFCPFYTHYGADPEHTAFARKIKKFAYPRNRESQVLHARINDKTRILSRSSRSKDLRLWEARKLKNVIWGISFNR